MNVLQLLVGKKMKVMTDLKVDVELEIKEVEVKHHSKQITPDTRENDWWGESINWKTYLVKYTNGATKEFDNITDIKIIKQMGGNALKLVVTRRYERTEFEVITNELTSTLKQTFKRVEMPLFYRKKESFGDADYILSMEGDR